MPNIVDRDFSCRSFVSNEVEVDISAICPSSCHYSIDNAEPIIVFATCSKNIQTVKGRVLYEIDKTLFWDLEMEIVEA